MKKHLYWGLGILILLLGVVGVFLLMPQNTDNESKPVLGEATKKLLKEGTEQTVVKPLPGETEAGLESVGTHPVKLEDISINWPEGADWPVNWKVLYNNLSEEEFAKLPQATKDAVNRAFYAEMGLEPPSPGYYHHRNKKIGKWELARNNVPIIEVRWEESTYNQFHQLTDAEYERYHALMWIADNQEAVASSVASGRHPHRILAYPPEVYELAQKWLDELHEKTYGPTLQAYANVYYDRPKTAADHEMVDRMMDEAMKTALPHRQRSTRPTDVVVDEILNEIEVELGITIKRKSE